VSDRALNLGFFVHFLSNEVAFYLMPDASTGFVTAVTAVIAGLVVEGVLKAFVDAGLIAPSLIIVCQLTGILALFVFVHATRYWGTFYLFGWWFGSGVMFYSGLLGVWEFGFYSVILLLVLFSRVKRGFE
jgi:hypothetical protein